MHRRRPEASAIRPAVLVEKPMITAKLVGAVVLGLPLLLIAWITLRRQRPVFLFAVALLLVGLGYLMATGATDDIGHMVLGAPEPVPAAVPAAKPAN